MPSGWSWPKPWGPTTPSTSPGRTLYSGSERSPTAPWPTTSRDCVGAPTVPVTAMNLLKKAGTYAITGLYHTLPQVDLGKVVRSEIDIYGTICYTRQEFEECLHFIEDGRVKVDPLITHHFPLREMEQAFAITQAKQSIKIILNP
ncbi:MAG: zinc-binding dehydrogenase [Evtepia gabavorous]